MRQALAGQQLPRPYIGIQLRPDRRSAVKKDSSLPVNEGAWVRPRTRTASDPAVRPGRSCRRRPGSRTGDIVTKINGQAIDTLHPLDAVLAQSSPGDKMTLTVLRDGKTLTIQVTLGVRPAGLG